MGEDKIVFGGGNHLYIVNVGTDEIPKYQVQVIAGAYRRNVSPVYARLDNAKNALFKRVVESYGAWAQAVC